MLEEGSRMAQATPNGEARPPTALKGRTELTQGQEPRPEWRPNAHALEAGEYC